MQAQLRTAPSCKSSGAEICTGNQPFWTSCCDARRCRLRCRQRSIRRRRSSFSDGPGEASTSSSRTIATIDAPVRVRARVSPSGRSTNDAAGQDVHLTSLEPGYFASELDEPFRDPRRAQNLGYGVSLLVVEAEDRAGLVRIVAGVQDDVEIAAAPGDDADPVTRAQQVNSYRKPTPGSSTSLTSIPATYRDSAMK